jgi:hypothetical protein
VKNWYLGNKISKYTVLVTANGERKTISTIEGQFGTVGIFICGYILTPFENRVLIILAEERFAIEGTDLFYIFLGCDLETGFNSNLVP